MNKGFVLKHEIDITLPFKNFERNIKDFNDKHKLGDRLAYACNSDGKFRAELKENPDDFKNYMLRISGWRDKQGLHIEKIYVGIEVSIYVLDKMRSMEQQELRPIKLHECVYGFLNLLEAWAIDHKGTFYFEYVDCNFPILDAYHIIKGSEKDYFSSEEQLNNILEQVRDTNGPVNPDPVK